MMSERQKLVDRYLRAAMIGTVAVALYPILTVAVGFIDIDEPSATELLIGVVWLLGCFVALIGLGYSLVYTFLRRGTDELTLAMWHSGTTVALFVAIAWLFFGDLVYIFYETFTAVNDAPEAIAREATSDNLIYEWALPVIFAGFFAGFHFKRVRG